MGNFGDAQPPVGGVDGKLHLCRTSSSPGGPVLEHPKWRTRSPGSTGNIGDLFRSEGLHDSRESGVSGQGVELSYRGEPDATILVPRRVVSGVIRVFMMHTSPD